MLEDPSAAPRRALMPVLRGTTRAADLLIKEKISREAGCSHTRRFGPHPNAKADLGWSQLVVSPRQPVLTRFNSG